ncbi:MAG: lantibiotic immunity ABC transporter MutE/EpiE family permease subunit [Roseburia sp.]|nr:lantibiotic immunity ABC transporter MutE/EpiE family permease subunit [Roseburia sp.]MCM1241778.1 lantibiotic immunity ABC transporter MutE/EpiE family permease subunit [Roseburia sp.]
MTVMKAMKTVVRAERIKLTHSFTGKVPLAASMLTLFLATFLMPGVYAAAGAWNWWYILMLHGMLAVFCYFSVGKDKKVHYYHSLSLATEPWKCWLGKVTYCALALFFSNLFIFTGTLGCHMLFGTTIPVANGLAGALLLSITCLWEIPFYLFLSVRFGMTGTVLTGIILPLAVTAGIADGPLWWLHPAAIPVRLMCPVLKILPNGILLESASPLNDAGVIWPGVFLSLLWFVMFTGITAI